MILVTGARGFLGRYLVEGLTKLEVPLYLTTGNREFEGDVNGLSFHYLNLEETESFDNLPDDIDTVIHLAAAIPKRNAMTPFSQFMNVNATGTRKLMEKVRNKGCRRFIYSSTQMVIDKPFYLPVDETHPLVPSTDYGLSKAIGERYCMDLSRTFNMQAISLRFSRIYGAGENPGFVLTNFIDRAMSGQSLIVHGTGVIQRDLMYVKDAVKALLCAVRSSASGIMNIGGGRGISIKELAETISEVFGDGLSRVEHMDGLDDEGYDYYMDIKKAYSELGFEPEFGLKEGMEDYRLECKKEKDLL